MTTTHPVKAMAGTAKDSKIIAATRPSFVFSRRVSGSGTYTIPLASCAARKCEAAQAVMVDITKLITDTPA